MLFVYGIKDIKEKVVGRGIFVLPNDAVARRSISVSLARDGATPIGLNDKVLVRLGTFDEESGLIQPNDKNQIIDVCSLKTLYDDVRAELKPYERK